MTLNLTIVAVYLVGMLAFGWWGKTRAASSEDYLVAGRRLGPVLFTGTMAAVVLGGAATVGGVGLGYEFGLSGAWLVAAIGVGVLILSVAFAPILARLKIYTVSQMLRLRYGRGGTEEISVLPITRSGSTVNTCCIAGNMSSRATGRRLRVEREERVCPSMSSRHRPAAP